MGKQPVATTSRPSVASTVPPSMAQDHSNPPRFSVAPSLTGQGSMQLAVLGDRPSAASITAPPDYTTGASASAMSSLGSAALETIEDTVESNQESLDSNHSELE